MTGKYEMKVTRQGKNYHVNIIILYLLLVIFIPIFGVVLIKRNANYLINDSTSQNENKNDIHKIYF